MFTPIGDNYPMDRASMAVLQQPAPPLGGATRFDTEEQRWNALRRRDPAADGIFYYGVRTTGVYCRPSCGARQPRRENVRFYDTPEAAERAGFRACKRCRPCSPSLAQRHAAIIARACRQIETAVTSPDPAVLARAAGLSRFHFHRLFKALTGLTPKAYMSAQRAQRARARLLDSSSVTAGIYDAGFNSSGRFYEARTAALGMMPKTYRNGGAGATVRFAIGQCSLGSILVAATDRGICAISLGDDAGALLRALQDRFPQAQLIGADAQFERLVARVAGLVESPARGLDLPLDLRGTAFQHRVWQALRAIAPGTTATYGQIARALGIPRSARAVAQAIAANPLAVAIPCHRVIRSDGALSGYRWGVARKRALLTREAKA
jgi:AraC family transcriptional regulator of adaptative response/methylated-DNA-[protein]-cysteine methyltransferase